MANFNEYLPKLERYEGFYSNHPLDGGGETLYGIARKTGAPFPEFWAIVDMYRARPNFPQNMVGDKQLVTMKNAWYKKNYWNVLKGDQIKSQKLAEQIVDMGINSGVGTAARLVYRMLGLPEKTSLTNEVIQKLNASLN